jgi:tellurite resistance protein TerC
MLEVTTTGWAVTIGLVLVLLAIDFALAVARPHEVGFREATLWSVFYIAVAIGFGLVFASFAGWGYGGEYFAGYIVEKSLSVDNLFVFVVIMTSFAVPAEHQQKVLIVGIILALILRVIFIALGAALLATFSFMFLLFGLLLVFTAVQLFRHRDQDPEVEDNALVRFAQRRLPVTEDYDGGILFALDSIPAVFGVTEETFIVFTANAFALLGLRALFFLVTGLLDRLVYLSTGLALILGFIGVKLALHWGHLQDDAVPEISTGTSLVVIAVVLTVTTIASVLKVRRDPDARAHAGSLRAHPQHEPD